MSMARIALKFALPAAAILALLTGTASAQIGVGSSSNGGSLMPSLSLGGDGKRKLTPEEQQKQEELDNAYKAATNKIPDKKPASDPWGDMRSSSPAAPAPNKKQQ